MTKKKRLITFIICLIIVLGCATPAYIWIISNLKDDSILLPFSWIFWGVMTLITAMEAFAIFTSSDSEKDKCNYEPIQHWIGGNPLSLYIDSYKSTALKWKDLTFSKEAITFKATLNDVPVTLECWLDNSCKEWCKVDFGDAPCNNMLFVHHGYNDDTDTQPDLFDALGFIKKEEN